MSKTTACITLGVLVSAMAGICAKPVGAETAMDLVVVSDDNPSHIQPAPHTSELTHGCDEVTVIDGESGREVWRSNWRLSPGRLAMTSDASVILSLSNNTSSDVRIMLRMAGTTYRWTSGDAVLVVLEGGPVAISPDDQTVLLAMMLDGVVKHRVSDITLTSLGPATGSLPGVEAAAIVFSPDSRTAYVVDTAGSLHVVEVETMREIGSPIHLKPVETLYYMPLRNTFASVSPDGNFLVVNTGGAELSVVDLASRQAMTIEAPGLKQTRGLAFEYSAPHENLLAVHGHSAVAVYRFHGMGDLELLAEKQVVGQEWTTYVPGERWMGRLDTLSWTGRGDGLVVAIGRDWPEYAVLEWEPGPPGRLTQRLKFDSCDYKGSPPILGMQLDVVTVNKPWVRKTPTPTASPCATNTPEPVITTSTATPTPPPTNTPTVTPSATPTPTVTPRPGPVYLPLSLREQCIPGQQRVDVALVIDASSSMENPTSTGRRKLDAALAAVTEFLDNLALPSDQAAVVVFNSDAWLRQELTGDRGLITSALQGIQTAKQTRLDRGVAAGDEELTSSRRRPGNQAVMIVLTDGLANPVPASVAVDEAAAAKTDQITIFAIGLGNELDEWALQAMASRPDYYYWAPDAEDLAGIYRRIAVTIPCPAGLFWGRR